MCTLSKNFYFILCYTFWFTLNIHRRPSCLYLVYAERNHAYTKYEFEEADDFRRRNSPLTQLKRLQKKIFPVTMIVVHCDGNFLILVYLALKMYAPLRKLSLHVRILPSILIAQWMNFLAQTLFLVKTK